MDIVLGAEIYSGYDTTEIREQIEKKRIYFRDKYREFYDLEVKFDEDIFTHYMESDYIPQKLRSPRQ